MNAESKLIVYVLIFGASLVGCGDGTQAPSPTSGGNYSARGSGGAPVRSPNSRKFVVFDVEERGFVFDVAVDGVPLGTTAVNRTSNWARDLTPGQHTIRISAHPGAPAPKTEFWINLFSGFQYPIFFVEPQGA